MKKNTLFTVLLALAGMMWTTSVQAQKVIVKGDEITEDGSFTPHGGTGTVTWNKATATLTLDNVNLSNTNSTFLRFEDMPLVKIVLVGNNLVDCRWQALYMKDCDVEFSGSGSLTVRSKLETAMQQSLSAPHTLTIKDCKFDVQGEKRSLLGAENKGNKCLTLVIDNATVKAKGFTNGSSAMSGIANLKAYQLKNCHIATPGVKFGMRPYLTYYELIDDNNQVYPGEVTIVPDNTTGISEVVTSGDVTVKAIYTPDGRQLQKMQRGLNIVKMSDGTTKKVVQQ